MKPERPWREIAEEISTEPDRGKVAEVSEELIRSLDNATKPSDPMPKRDEERVRKKAA